MVEHALPSRLLKDQTLDIHFQFSVVVEVQTMFSTVQKGDLQRAAHCALLSLLEFVLELFELQVLAPSQKHPNAFCEGLHYCFVILGPSL